MATWVDCSSAPSYFGGFAADMGLYIGPWPLLPPGKVAGVTIGQSVYFYVALPNPVAPGDETHAIDGSYDTPLWYAYRYDTGGGTPATKFDYAGDSSGPSAPFAVPTDPPTGVHIWVTVDGSTVPSDPPESYVPASYAASGASTLQTAMGTWSSDQTGFDKVTSHTPVGGPSLISFVNTTTGENQDIATDIDALIATLIATTPTGYNGNHIWANKQSVPSTFMELGASSIIYNFDASYYIRPSDGYPASLGSLTWDLDYSDTPYIGTDGSAGIEYAFDVPTDIAFTWGPLVLTGDNTVAAPGGSAMPPDYTDFDVPWRIGWDSGTVPVTDTPAWTYAGTSLGDHLGISGSSVDPSITVDLSSITAAVFHVYLGETFLYTGTTGATNFVEPDGVTYLRADYFRAFTEDFVHPLPLTVHFPTWKYWIPGDIVTTGGISLELETVGEHFRSVRGDQIYIKQQDGHWEPIKLTT